MSITKLNNLSVSALTALPSGVGGKVLQVVSATDSTERSTTSTSYVTASNTLSVSITPSSASNKIFITTHFMIGLSTTSNSFYTIFRDSTNLGNANGMAVFASSSASNEFPTAMSFLDSPSSTSAITYQVYVKSPSGATARLVKGSHTASITAFEIAG